MYKKLLTFFSAGIFISIFALTGAPSVFAAATIKIEPPPTDVGQEYKITVEGCPSGTTGIQVLVTSTGGDTTTIDLGTETSVTVNDGLPDEFEKDKVTWKAVCNPSDEESDEVTAELDGFSEDTATQPVPSPGPPPCRKALVDPDGEGEGSPEPQTFDSRNQQAEYFKANPGASIVKCLTVATGVGDIDVEPVAFISSIMVFLLSISGGIALLLIIFAGYQLVASRGEPDKIAAARELLTSAIVGLLFIIFSIVVLEIIGVDILRIPGFEASSQQAQQQEGVTDDQLAVNPPDTQIDTPVRQPDTPATSPENIEEETPQSNPSPEPSCGGEGEDACSLWSGRNIWRGGCNPGLVKGTDGKCHTPQQPSPEPEQPAQQPETPAVDPDCGLEGKEACPLESGKNFRNGGCIFGTTKGTDGICRKPASVSPPVSPNPSIPACLATGACTSDADCAQMGCMQHRCNMPNGDPNDNDNSCLPINVAISTPPSPEPLPEADPTISPDQERAKDDETCGGDWQQDCRYDDDSIDYGLCDPDHIFLYNDGKCWLPKAAIDDPLCGGDGGNTRWDGDTQADIQEQKACGEDSECDPGFALNDSTNMCFRQVSAGKDACIDGFQKNEHKICEATATSGEAGEGFIATILSPFVALRDFLVGLFR